MTIIAFRRIHDLAWPTSVAGDDDTWGLFMYNNREALDFDGGGAIVIPFRASTEEGVVPGDVVDPRGVLFSREQPLARRARDQY